jgi:hypothetical protein
MKNITQIVIGIILAFFVLIILIFFTGNVVISKNDLKEKKYKDTINDLKIESLKGVNDKALIQVQAEKDLNNMAQTELKLKHLP